MTLSIPLSLSLSLRFIVEWPHGRSDYKRWRLSSFIPVSFFLPLFLSPFLSFFLSHFLSVCVFLAFGNIHSYIHSFTARSAALGWLGGPPPSASESTGNAFLKLARLPLAGGASVILVVVVGVLGCIVEVPIPDQDPISSP